MNTAAWDIQDHNASPGVPAGQGVVEGNELPYRPEMLAKKHENFKNRQTADPETKCYMPGVPRATYMPFPFQIVQTPKQVTVAVRVRAYGAQYLHGHSPSARPACTGGWATREDAGRATLSSWTSPTSTMKRGSTAPETFTVTRSTSSSGTRWSTPDHINYEATIEDPQVFTRPWKMSMILYRHREKNFRLLEYECFSW